MRARQQGSKLKDGRWLIRLTLTQTNGGKFQKAFYGRTQSEVQSKVRAFLSGNEERRPQPNMSLAAWLESWLNSKEWRSASTQKSYAGTVRLHIVPRIGHIKLRDLLAADVERMCLDIKAEGKERTPSIAREVLRTALKAALKNRLIQSNPAHLADHPGYESRTRPMLTLEELRRVLAWEEVPLWRALWVFLAETGFRPAEARMLHWNEINKEEDGYWIALTHAKTKASRRPRPISDRLYKALLAVRGESLFVFANPETKRPYLQIGERWNEAVKYALNPPAEIERNMLDPHYKLQERNLYQLRKLFGRMQAKRVPDHVLKTLMGHSDIRTTKLYYIDAEREELRTAVYQMDIEDHGEESRKA
jgi:integrase